jgi:hypothetical protein
MTTGRRIAGPRAGAAVPFDAITAAGAYVCNWSGHLLRVPAHSLQPQGTLALNMIGGEPLTVTKISDDPGSATVGSPWLAQSLVSRRLERSSVARPVPKKHP